MSLQERFGVLTGRVLEAHAATLFSVLRRRKPIVVTPRVAIVARRDDVLEVLHRPDVFGVPYGPKMEAVTGPFMLGEDDTPHSRAERARLRAARPPAAIERNGEHAAEAAERRIAAARPRGRIDVVTELLDPVLVEVSTRALGATAPDEATLLRWTRDIFQDIFLDAAGTPSIHARSLAAAAEMRPHVDADVARGAPGEDDLLSRLLAEPDADRLAIRHALIGLVTGWIPTASKAIALAVDELLRRPAELASAAQAARAGADDRAAGALWEAMRLRPQTAGLLRVCLADAEVAARTPRAATVPAGATVFAATASALRDPAAVPAASAFRADRGLDSLTFGDGLHRCYGEPVNRRQIPAIGLALLRLPGLRRAGPLRFSGPYPSSLPVAFDP